MSIHFWIIIIQRLAPSIKREIKAPNKKTSTIGSVTWQFLHKRYPEVKINKTPVMPMMVRFFHSSLVSTKDKTNMQIPRNPRRIGIDQTLLAIAQRNEAKRQIKASTLPMNFKSFFMCKNFLS